jgi:hypothetical protein
MNQLVISNPEISHDMINDHNNIENLLVIGYILKTSKLIILIFNVSYFIGNGFYILCDVSQRILSHYHSLLPPEGVYNTEFFITYFGLE